MRIDVLIPIAASIPLGLFFYIIFTRNIKAHLRSWIDRISFFFWPYGPFRMLVIQELDGEYQLLYNYDYEEIQSEDKTLIKTVYGDQYVTETPPSQANIATSLFEARGPPNYYSPFAVAWRWIVAASIMVYILYYALVISIVPAIEIAEVQVGLETLQIARVRPIDPWEVTLTLTAFFVAITWLIVNIQRMNDRSIMYSWYHAKGINPPHISIVPSPTISSIGLLEYLKQLGRKINIVVPNESAEIINKAIKQVEEKTGSKSLAAVILAKLALAKTWRESLAKVLREEFSIFKAGETSAAVRLNVESITKRTIPIMILIFIVGLVIGYGLGNVIGIGVGPAPGNQTFPAMPEGNYTQPYPGNQTSPPIQPPPMPQPPTGVIGIG